MHQSLPAVRNVIPIDVRVLGSFTLNIRSKLSCLVGLASPLFSCLVLGSHMSERCFGVGNKLWIISALGGTLVMGRLVKSSLYNLQTCYSLVPIISLRMSCGSSPWAG